MCAPGLLIGSQKSWQKELMDNREKANEKMKSFIVVIFIGVSVLKFDAAFRIQFLLNTNQ